MYARAKRPLPVSSIGRLVESGLFSKAASRCHDVARKLRMLRYTIGCKGVSGCDVTVMLPIGRSWEG